MTILTVDKTSEELIPHLVRYLENAVRKNDSYGSPMRTTSLFQCVSKPNISFENYIRRIVKYNPVTATVYVQAMIYLERITKLRRGLTLTSLTVHRLFLTAIAVATKFLEDKFYNNRFFAKLGGVSLSDINQMELEFLFLVEFDLNVTGGEFNLFKQKLVNPEKGFLAQNIENAFQTEVLSYLGMGRRKSMTTLMA